jgi:DNA/RNA-binding domain of Phe-tRNA-synthetase-like protein
VLFAALLELRRQTRWAEIDPLADDRQTQWSRIMEQGDVLIATDAWRSAFPGACAGALVMSGVRNPEESAALEHGKRDLEERLRGQAARAGRRSRAAETVLRAYVDYYRSHGKSYHVKAQWESVALKGRPIPRRAALVEAMFMAELENLMLTAGHDLATLIPPVRVDVTRDGDRYTLLNGSERVLGTRDMMMADGEGIVSSVLHGPDRRTRITPETREVLFAVYAPAGIGEAAVRDHLEDIRANVLQVTPDAATELLVTLPASSAGLPYDDAA